MSLILVPLCLLNLALIPLLLAGVTRRSRARMRNRSGPPVLQPFYDLSKLFQKGETASETSSWISVAAPWITVSIAVTAVVVLPWSGFGPPAGSHWADLVLMVYLFGLGRFFTMLASMDSGSAVGGLGACREAALSALTEPVVILGLGALALEARSTDLSSVYAAPGSPWVALFAAGALAVAALAEVSRMPADDPSSRSELTMVQEALFLENSGRNLGITQLSAALRTTVFLGLTVQTLLRAWPGYSEAGLPVRYLGGIAGLFAAGVLIAAAEGITVRKPWRHTPAYLAFGTALSVIAAIIAVARA